MPSVRLMHIPPWLWFSPCFGRQRGDFVRADWNNSIQPPECSAEASSFLTFMPAVAVIGLTGSPHEQKITANCLER